MTLTPTQAAILAAALQHPQHLVAPPARLAPAPRDAVRKSLLAKGLIEPAAVEAPDEATAWTVDGACAHYRLAEAGILAACGTAETDSPTEAATAATSAPEPPQSQFRPGSRPGGPTGRPGARQRAFGRRGPPDLREAATAVLTAWDASERAGVDEAISALRLALARKAPRQPCQTGTPREGTKQERVLAMVGRPEGATVAQIAEATGWQHHTVRGVFAGLQKRQRIAVNAAERVRQVGVDGTKGSYTLYRITDAG